MEKKEEKEKNSDKTKELFEFDLKFNCRIAGCDEAGRGPLAGPLVCAACIMPLDNMIDGINDSKVIPEQKRERLYQKIIEKAISYHVAIVDCRTIDEVNILNATKTGMQSAINALNTPKLVLIDAVKLQTNYPIIPIIKGDAKSYNIAAASIIAKVTRDRIMRSVHEQFPIYGFDKHKGYGTAQHISALKQNGACSQHRQTFIKNFFDNISLNRKKNQADCETENN